MSLRSPEQIELCAFLLSCLAFNPWLFEKALCSVVILKKIKKRELLQMGKDILKKYYCTYRSKLCG